MEVCTGYMSYRGCMRRVGLDREGEHVFRILCNYLRGCWCKHDFELLAEVRTHDTLGGTSTHQTFRCNKCGFVQRVRL